MRAATRGSSAKSSTPRSRSARKMTQPAISAHPASGRFQRSGVPTRSFTITRAASAGGRAWTGRPKIATASARMRVW